MTEAPIDEIRAVTQVPILVPKTTNKTALGSLPIVIPAPTMEIKIVVNMKEQNRCLQTQIVAYK